MGVPWAWLFLATSVALLVKHFRSRDLQPLEWEEGRRKARVPFQKDARFYASFGVKSSEEFVRLSRNIEIFTKQWLPLDGQYKALVLYCHGYGDTCAYLFEDTAVRLAAAHYAVVSMDYEGHGQSQGLHGYIRRFDSIVEDVAEHAEMLKRREGFQGLPAFLFGESMGGAVALKLHFYQPYAWDGAVLLAPMCKIADEMIPSPLLVFVLKILARIVPKWKVVPTKDILEEAFRVPEKRAKGGGNPTAYAGKPRLGSALQLVLATEEINRKMEKVVLPLLILHGGADTVTDPGVSRALYERSRSNEKTFNLYPESYHALLAGEPDDIIEKVLSDILSWLDSRSASIGSMPAGGLQTNPVGTDTAAHALHRRKGAPPPPVEEEASSTVVTPAKGGRERS
eukprot:TRINITY_DN20144_c0_g2_i1.p1 TRINITY_DN20144_c0_g2~~TRINITY_DN20144_c0_g2_i1.p1  ORF type:complete len:397 (+),score=72.88 TRINITY_DN20144_c0_g2_i1:134-1324(+)